MVMPLARILQASWYEFSAPSATNGEYAMLVIHNRRPIFAGAADWQRAQGDTVQP